MFVVIGCVLWCACVVCRVLFVDCWLLSYSVVVVCGFCSLFVDVGFCCVWFVCCLLMCVLCVACCLLAVVCCLLADICYVLLFVGCC